jgi:hypothetical protein
VCVCLCVSLGVILSHLSAQGHIISSDDSIFSQREMAAVESCSRESAEATEMNNVYSGLMEIIVITERVCDAHTKWNGRKLDSELHRRKKEREKFRPRV